jgi:hypothetical protein
MTASASASITFLAYSRSNSNCFFPDRQIVFCRVFTIE